MFDIEFTEINLLEASGGFDTIRNLELGEIRIKIANYKKKYYNGYYEKVILQSPIIRIKSKGSRKYFEFVLDFDTFDKIFYRIDNLEFKNIYSERNFCFDGGDLELEIKKIGKTNMSKKLF